MKLFKLIAIFATLALSVYAGYWDNVERTEFYAMIENKVPVFRITMADSDWQKQVSIAQVKARGDISGKIEEVPAKMKFILDGKEENYDIEIRVGGKSSMEFSRTGYNIKIKGKDQTLHGTKNIRLRSDQRDPTFMRTKLTSEILLKSGLVTVDTGYCELYINDQYMGFWIVSDSIKKNWLNRNFGVSGEIKTLFQCTPNNIRFETNSAKNLCFNAFDEFSGYMEPFNQFVDKVNAARSRADLEKFFDVDNFLKYIAWEYLVGSWDHFLGPFGHNVYWYQQPNGIWVYLPYDFDLDLGSCLWADQFSSKSYTTAGDNIQFPAVTFKDFESDNPIIKILVHNDDSRFREILGDVVSKVFNPDTLLIRIDELKKVIEPYVKKTIETGAGKINKKCPKQANWTMDDFYENCEYTFLYDYKDYVKAFGLKDWIRRRYNTVAGYYGIDDKTHKLIEPRPTPKLFPVVENNDIETVSDRMKHHHIGTALPPYTPNKNYEDNSVPVLGVNQYNLARKGTSANTQQQTQTSSGSCWAEALGYQCCSNGCNAVVVTEEDNRFWGVENGQWCGINCNYENDACPNKKYGYPCCSNCNVYYVDDTGKWGVENNDWCSIKNSCN